MKASELIAILEKHDPDMEVIVYKEGDDAGFDIDDVSVEENEAVEILSINISE